MLERYGLRVLSKTRRPGLKALMRVSRMEEGERTTTDIGFRIGPRLNAPGRLGAADGALALLLSYGRSWVADDLAATSRNSTESDSA